MTIGYSRRKKDRITLEDRRKRNKRKRQVKKTLNKKKGIS